MRKQPPNQIVDRDKLYITYDENSKGSVVSQYKQPRDFSNAVYHTRAADTNIVNRAPYSPGTYENSRPFAGLPYFFRDIVYSCRSAYYTVGVVRNVVDLLTDFVCEDIKIIHGDKKTEAFFKVWSKKIGLYDVVTEFAKHLLIDANVVIRRSTAKLNTIVGDQWKEQAEKEAQTVAKPDIKLYKERLPLGKGEIPIKYSFLNVAALEWVDEDGGKITGSRQLAFKVGSNLVKKIKGSESDLLSQFSNTLKKEDLDALEKTGEYKIDMTKVHFASVKKDSWQDWAVPYMYSVLSYIKYKERLYQLDMAATDGTINPIRLWKIGDHKEKILPADGAISRLAEILNNNPGGGPVDIIWDSMIEMEAFYPPIAEIIGSEKYDQVDKDILVGLGVPEVLLGGKGANFSNSFIQLKTITERVKYIRHQIKHWLEQEVKLLCETMEIDTLPLVRFGQMNLEDENTTKKLIVDLLDRGIISVEAVLDAYGEDFVIEIDRKKREKNIFKQNSFEVKSPFDQKETPLGGSKGRPPKTKETQKRSTRTPKPRRSTASIIPAAIERVKKLDELLTKIYLEKNNIANARKLTNANTDEINCLRIGILSTLDLQAMLDEMYVIEALKNIKPCKVLIAKVNEMIKAHMAQNGEMSLNDRLVVEAVTWSALKEEQNEVQN